MSLKVSSFVCVIVNKIGKNDKIFVQAIFVKSVMR